MPQQKNTIPIWKRQYSFGGVNATDRVTFAKHISVMLSSGLSIVEALDIAVDSSRGSLRRVLRKVKSSIESGNSFAQSLAEQKGTFSELFISAVEAGEKSGTLEENLAYVAEQLEKEKKMNGKVKSAMAYPVIILAASGLLAMGMAYYVLPQIIPLFSGLQVDLPLSTRMVMWFSTVVRDHGNILFPGIIIGVVALVVLLKQRFMHPMTHLVLIKMPVVKHVVIKSNLARVSLTLGTLLKSGLDIQQALQITAGAATNFYYRRSLKQAVDRISGGTALAKTLGEHESLYPKLLVSMVRVGESAGSLDETLLYVAGFYESEVDNATKTLTTAIEPVLLLGIGLVVGTLALGIITPIYEVTGNLNR